MLFGADAPRGGVDLAQIRASMIILSGAVEIGHIDCLVADVSGGAIVEKLFTDVEFAVYLHVAICV